MAAASRTVAVAASGGRDSTALLHATARAAAGMGVQVVALHVHHGLMPDADAWCRAVQVQCEQWARDGLPVRCEVERLPGSPARGDSVEAWARRERYAALTRMARGADAAMVLLAHHRRDQAETVLLQLLRGAGAAGLAAMPRTAERGGLVWARPWLNMPRKAIDAYVHAWQLGVVDDPSNRDPRYARSRLRTSVWPALVAAFPDAELALTQAARQAALAATVLDEVAAQDLHGVRAHDDMQALDQAAWCALGPARRELALRAWLRQHAPDPSVVRHTLLTRLARELPGATTACWPLDAAHELRLYRGRLRVGSRLPAPPEAQIAPCAIDWRHLGPHRLPAWGGTLVLRPVEEGGVPVSLLSAAVLRHRRPGDVFQSGPGRPVRALKKQFQAAGLSAWLRQAPVVATAEALVFVPGLGLDARAAAAPGQPRCVIDWVADA
ncbi:tRNA lysidine(34) synthetase TilS [Ideonella sp.]|uniref:tRNA lysidine(34) synthetase TilS n=1 Tax=Ideonella sp. TaxID=1929293 RepID=UPI0035AD78FF